MPSQKEKEQCNNQVKIPKKRKNTTDWPQAQTKDWREAGSTKRQLSRFSAILKGPSLLQVKFNGIKCDK